MCLLFITWDAAFSYIGVWSFNENYTLGINILWLPIEEWLFFITVPFACVFIYECLNTYFPNEFFNKRARLLNLILFILCLITYFTFPGKLYTAITALFTGFALLIHLLFLRKNKYMGNFYRAYLVAIIPMLVVNGLLTSKPVVIYNELEKTSFRIGSIPWEDFLYNLLMFLMVVGFYEMLKRKKAVKI